MTTLDVATHNAAGHMHERVVIEGQVRYGSLERILDAHTCRITSFVHEGVSVLCHRDIVFADGHTDFKAAILIRFHHFALLCAHITIHIQITALHRIGGVLVVYDTAYGEAADILERHIIVCERAAAHITSVVVRTELVDTHYRTHQVGGTVAAEGHTADDVVTVHVGQSVK